MLHAHICNVLTSNLEVISPHGRTLSEQIKRDPWSTLTEFCFGIENNGEVEKGHEKEAEDFDEEGRFLDRRKRLKKESL